MAGKTMCRSESEEKRSRRRKGDEQETMIQMMDIGKVKQEGDTRNEINQIRDKEKLSEENEECGESRGEAAGNMGRKIR